MIASYLNIPKQQLSVTVRNLEQNGYIVKKQDTVDKRAVLISLTDKAEKYIMKDGNKFIIISLVILKNSVKKINVI